MAHNEQVDAECSSSAAVACRLRSLPRIRRRVPQSLQTMIKANVILKCSWAFAEGANLSSAAYSQVTPPSSARLFDLSEALDARASVEGEEG